MKLEVNTSAASAHALLEEFVAYTHILTTRGTHLPLKGIVLIVAVCNAVMATHDLLIYLMAASCKLAALPTAHCHLTSHKHSVLHSSSCRLLGINSA